MHTKFIQYFLNWEGLSINKHK